MSRDRYWHVFWGSRNIIGLLAAGLIAFHVSIFTRLLNVPPQAYVYEVCILGFAALWLFLAGLSRDVRRLHDRGMSGAILLFIPVAGVLPLCVLLSGMKVSIAFVSLMLPLLAYFMILNLMTRPGNADANRYGEFPPP